MALSEDDEFSRSLQKLRTTPSSATNDELAAIIMGDTSHNPKDHSFEETSSSSPRGGGVKDEDEDEDDDDDSSSSSSGSLQETANATEEKAKRRRHEKIENQLQVLRRLKTALEGSEYKSMILKHQIDYSYASPSYKFAGAGGLVIARKRLMTGPISALKGTKIEITANQITKMYGLLDEYGFLFGSSKNNFFKSSRAQPRCHAEKLIYDYCASSSLLKFLQPNKGIQLDLLAKTTKYLGDKNMPFEFLISVMTRAEIGDAYLTSIPRDDEPVLYQFAHRHWHKSVLPRLENAENSELKGKIFKEFWSECFQFQQNYTDYMESEEVTAWLVEGNGAGVKHQKAKELMLRTFDEPTLILLEDRLFVALFHIHQRIFEDERASL